MSKRPQRVLVTGVAGPIGQALREGLSSRYELLRVSDLLPIAPACPGEQIVDCDITDMKQVMAAADAMDAIVHLAGESTEASVAQFLRLNFDGAWNVYEAARRQGVRRVILASSNHVVGCNPRGTRIDDRTPVRPDSRYGVSKAFGEALGSLYADKHGLEIVNVRIGSFQPQPRDRRELSTWLSPGDMVRLTITALETPSVHCETVFGISGNHQSWWDNRRAFGLGYVPQDDAEVWAKTRIDPVPDEIAGPYGRSVHGSVWADHGMGCDPGVLGTGLPPRDPVPPASKVLITGAAGHIGGVLRRGLAGCYSRLRLSDIDPPGAAQSGEETVMADLTDFAQVQAAVEGVDAIVHLGAIAGEARWERILASNIAGTWNLFEAAREAGVRRVIFASSNHVVGFYPRNERVDHLAVKRPDTRYGLSKAFGEDLGRMMVDKYGFAVMCMRIGTCQSAPTDARMLSTWISHEDMVRLVRTGLDAPELGFAVVYGASANQRSWWDNRLATRLGYAPRDDAQAWANTLLAQDPPEPGGPTAMRHQGGIYTEMA